MNDQTDKKKGTFESGSMYQSFKFLMMFRASFLSSKNRVKIGLRGGI